jgi:hypothetical protein
VADKAVEEAKVEVKYVVEALVAVNLLKELSQARLAVSAKSPAVEMYGMRPEVKEETNWFVVEAVVEVTAVVEAKVIVPFVAVSPVKFPFVADSAVDDANVEVKYVVEALVAVSLLKALFHARLEVSAKSPAVEAYGMRPEVKEVMY